MESKKSVGALYAELGQTLFDEERYKEALDALQKATKEDASDVPITWIWLTLGKTYKKLNKPQEAQQALIKAVQLDINVFEEASKEFFEITEGEMDAAERGGTFQSTFSRAISRFFPSDIHMKIRKTALDFVEKGEYAKAETFLLNLTTLWPDDVETLEALGISQLRQEKVLESMDAFQKVIHLDSRRSSAHRGLGEVYNQLHKSSEAIASFNRALELIPDDTMALLGRGVAYRESDMLDDSIKDLQEAIKHAEKKDPNLYRELSNSQQAAEKFSDASCTLSQAAELLIQEGKYRQAKLFSQEAISLDRTCGPAHLALGKALIHLGQGEDGLGKLTEGAEIIKSPDAYYILSQAYFEEGKLSDAKESVEQVLALTPDSVDSLILYAKILRLSDNLKDARDTLDKALGQDPQNIEVLTEKGAVLEALNLQTEALQAYRQVVEQNPHDYLAYERMGLIHLQLKDYAQALSTLDQSITPDSKASIHTARGEALFYLNQFEDAITAFDQALRMDPEDFDASRYRGACLLVLDKFEESVAASQLAIDLASAQDIKNNVGWTYANLGEALRNLRRVKEAERAFKTAIKLGDKDSWILARYGETLRFLEKEKEATRILLQAIELDDQNSFAWDSLGANYLDQSMYRSALDAFDKAIEIEDGNDYFAWSWKGIILRSNSRYQAAIDALDQAIELERTSWVLCEKAITYRIMSNEGCEQALPLLQEALGLDPNYSWAHGQLGVCLYTTGRYNEALFALQKALDLDTTFYWAQAVKSLVFRRLGQTEKAEEAHRMALKEDDSSSEWGLSLVERGANYEDLGAYELAEQDFKQAIDSNPLEAYNSLAWLYADSMNEKLEEATELAQKGVHLVEGKGNDINLAMVLDTLGWTYYKRKLYSKALPILKRAFSLYSEQLEVEDHIILCESALQEQGTN